MEFKRIKFNQTEIKQEQVNGIDVGIIRGYLATWDLDRGNDRFVKGCFAVSIREHIEKSRQIRMKAYHDVIIGGFPIEKVYEDEKGLFVEGHINLIVNAGKEVYALAKQGVLVDMSIGWSAEEVTFDDNIRVITKAGIWEGSIVDEPMNTQAQISEVKAINPRSELPKSFADRSRLWDSDEAEKRIRSWAGAEDAPNEQYKSAFMYFDQEQEDVFGGYKLLVSDIVDGQVKIVPRAVFAIRAVLSGARGGVDISSQDQEKARGVVNTLYEEMGLEKPFSDGKSRPFCITELKSVPIGMLGDILRRKELSKDAADYAARAIYAKIAQDGTDASDIKELSSTVKNLIKELKK